MDQRRGYNGRGSRKGGEDEPELSEDEIRSLRSFSRFLGHVSWLWHYILRPAVITAVATLLALPALVSAIKELWKGLGGGK
jgi:hypothetical protein